MASGRCGAESSVARGSIIDAWRRFVSYSISFFLCLFFFIILLSLLIPLHYPPFFVSPSSSPFLIYSSPSFSFPLFFSLLLHLSSPTSFSPLQSGYVDIYCKDILSVFFFIAQKSLCRAPHSNEISYSLSYSITPTSLVPCLLSAYSGMVE